MKRARILAGWVALSAILCAAAVTQPHVAGRWALYLGNASSPDRAHLYLDPFPNEVSCVRQVRVFTAWHERAFCAERYELEFGNAADAVLAADFDRILPIGWYCTPRLRRAVGAAR